MRETFDPKEPGDALLARDINDLQTVARRVARWRGGTFANMFHGESFMGASARSPRFVALLEVVDMTADDEEESAFSSGYNKYSGLHFGIIRWFDRTEGEWRTLETGQELDTPHTNKWLIDARECYLDLKTGDKVPCFWHAQRGAFVPCETFDTPLYEVTGTKALTGSAPGDLIAIWYHFDLTLGIAYRTKDSEGTVGDWTLMNHRRFMKTGHYHFNDGETRYDSLTALGTWYNEDNHEVHIALDVDCDREPSTIDAVIRVEILKGNREAEVVNGIGINVQRGRMDLSADDVVRTNDYIAGPDRQIFSVHEDGYIIVRPPQGENLQVDPRWTIRCTAEAQYEF